MLESSIAASCVHLIFVSCLLLHVAVASHNPILVLNRVCVRFHFVSLSRRFSTDLRVKRVHSADDRLDFFLILYKFMRLLKSSPLLISSTLLTISLA